jgi:GT2 family glycosyltransferase
MIDVSISIISTNEREELERLLPTLRSATQKVNAEIFLVDNLCDDGTGDFVRQNYPEIQVTRNTVRMGFGANHNQNLSKAEGRYFAVMNPDIIVEENTFTRLTHFMDKNSDIGIASPKFYYEDGSLQYIYNRYPTVFDLFLRRFMPKPLRRFFKKRMDYYEMRDMSYDQVFEVPFLPGAFMFCRKNLLKSLDGFDPGYFIYFDDADLCRRVQKTHRTVFYPDAVVTHTWKRAAHTNWKFMYYLIESGFRYFGHWGYKFF